ncbi:MAG: hypothetical protein WA708_20175 [Acidobacteriaceae bacterium]
MALHERGPGEAFGPLLAGISLFQALAIEQLHGRRIQRVGSFAQLFRQEKLHLVIFGRVQ